VGPFGEEVINDNGDKLIDICEKNSLQILNGSPQTRPEKLCNNCSLSGRKVDEASR